MPPYTIVEVWVVKYALTQGLYRVDAKRSNTDDSGILSYEAQLEGSSLKFTEFLHRKDYEYTYEQAIDAANKKKQKKMDSMAKQYKKIAELIF